MRREVILARKSYFFHFVILTEGNIFFVGEYLYIQARQHFDIIICLIIILAFLDIFFVFVFCRWRHDWRDHNETLQRWKFTVFPTRWPLLSFLSNRFCSFDVFFFLSFLSSHIAPFCVFFVDVAILFCLLFFSSFFFSFCLLYLSISYRNFSFFLFPARIFLENIFVFI